MSLPHTQHALPAYHALASAELSSNLARVDGVRYGARVAADDPDAVMAMTRGHGFGAETKRRILLGTYMLSEAEPALRDGAVKARALVTQDFEAVFAQALSSR